jgi:ABC-type multidrug transport system ATPase subunit
MTAAAPTAAASDFDVVTIEGLSRHYGRRRALSQVSWTCHAGGVLGLFGPNGSGKSTLLSVLSTLGLPSAGRVLYGDRTAREWGDALRGRIGVLGHDLFLYADLTARENLLFFGRLHGVRDLETRVDEGLRLARLEARAHDRVSGFSRGLRQRLALERALIHAPRLVLLDEPFTGLDDASAALLVDRLRILRAAGAIVVMATHDFDLAEQIVDESVCLTNGRLVRIPAGDASLRDRYRQAVAVAVERA